MAPTRELKIIVLGDASKGQKALQSLAGDAEQIEGKVSGVGKAVSGLGRVFVGAKLAEGLFDAANAASDLGEAQNATNVIFKDAGPAIDDFAKNALDNLGLAEVTVRKLASGVGGMFSAVGLAADKSAAMTQGLILRAVDVGSVFNETAEIVTEAFGAALRGESEPARRFGVFLNEAAIKAEALSSGLVKAEVSTIGVMAAQVKAEEAGKKYAEAVKAHGENSNEATLAAAAFAKAEEAVGKAMEGTTVELTDAQKMQAAYNIIMRSTEQTQGDYAKTADSAANAQRRASEAAKEAKASLGDSLAPILAKMSELAVALAGAFSAMPEPLQNLTAGLIALAAVSGPISGLVTVIGGLSLAAAGWIGLAALLVAAGVLLIANWEAVKAKAGEVWDWVGEKIGWFVGFFGSAVFGPFALAVGAIVQNWDWIRETAGNVWDWITGKVEGFVGFFAGVPGRIRDAASGMWDGIYDAFRGAVNAVVGAWNRLAIPGFSINIPLPGPIPDISFSWGGLSLPDIPYLARGGTATQAGFAVVGDDGPEVAWLPRGAQVAPLNGTGPLFESGGDTITLVVPLTVDGREVARATARYNIAELKRHQRRNGGRT